MRVAWHHRGSKAGNARSVNEDLELWSCTASIRIVWVAFDRNQVPNFDGCKILRRKVEVEV